MLRNIFFSLTLLIVNLLLLGCQSSEQMKTTQKTEINANVIDSVLSDLVKTGSVIGVSALIYSGNKEIYYGAFGQADKEAQRPWQRNTLATLYSMTKPITGTTLMSLYEEGLFKLEDPLSKYLPEYANVKVLQNLDADGAPIFETPNRPIHVIDIFRHTACFGYGWENVPAAAFMTKAQLFNSSKPLSQFSKELADVPLYCHPGEQWKYGASSDVQARLAEVITGQPFDEIVRERVLDPLGLSEIRYFVPPKDKPRLAAVYHRNNAGQLSRLLDSKISSFRTKKPVQINGGHGLTSSIDDYMRFALMLQNNGTLNGIQILKPETVALMTKDHLPPSITKKDFLPSKGQVGFGLNFAVRIAEPADSNESFGVIGEFFWDGAASPLFWVDPKNNITVVFLTQVLPFNKEAHTKFRRAVYEALNLVEKR